MIPVVLLQDEHKFALSNLGFTAASPRSSTHVIDDKQSERNVLLIIADSNCLYRDASRWAQRLFSFTVNHHSATPQLWVKRLFERCLTLNVLPCDSDDNHRYE